MRDNVPLTVVSTEAEAEVICGRLREAGIACTHKQTDFGAGAWDASAPYAGPREILVAAEDLDAAREVLAGVSR